MEPRLPFSSPRTQAYYREWLFLAPAACIARGSTGCNAGKETAFCCLLQQSTESESESEDERRYLTSHFQHHHSN